MLKLRRLFFLASLYCFCCSIADARVIYVSSSQGNDKNDGFSTASPVSTIVMALTKGDSILLKCGDVFYESVRLQHCYLSQYANGRLPVICGYKRVVAPRWEKVEDNIWKISLSDGNYNGNTANALSSMANNIGCLHDIINDSIHGRKVRYRELLKHNWDIWQTDHFNARETIPSDFDSLYLYLNGNPNKLCIEFSVGSSGVVMSNATVEGIRIEGFGGHGIAAKSNSTIRNCVIDAIGGKTQVGYEVFTSLGNGVEFYVSENISECLVENCKVSRCYDCGITIQGSDCGQATPSNIIVRNNLIFDCCQGWEDFLRNDSNVVFKDCVFENNIILNSGKTSGFNYPPRFKYCHVLGNNFNGNKGMVIKDNIFVGGNFYCSGAYKGKYKSNVWKKNTCFIKRGEYILSNYVGTADVIRIPTEKGNYGSLKKATLAAISRYREMTGDMTTRFVIEKENKLNKRIAKFKKRYL